MNKKSITIGLLIISLTIITTACSQNNTKNENTNKEKPSTTNQNSTTNENIINKEEYKNILTTNYEKYILPLELNDCDEAENILASNSEIDNQQIIDKLKTHLSDNKTNIKSFENSITDLNIEDSKLDISNKKLIKESKNVILDIEEKEKYLDTIDKDILAKTSTEFVNYIDEQLDKDSLEKNKFDDIIDELENLLGIKLDR